MKITTHQREFYNALNKVSGAMTGRSNLEITKGIYFSCKNNIALFRATNLELELEYSTKMEVADNKPVVFPKEIIDIVKNLPKTEVIITIDDNYQATIKAGKSKFSIKCLNGEEFPRGVGEIDNRGVEIDSNVLKPALEKTVIAVSNDYTQPAITGVQLQTDKNNTYLTSTNIYRLHNIKLDKLFEKGQIIIPGSAANEIKNLCGETDTVVIKKSDNHIQFIFDDITLISRLIEGRFPNWRQVMPTGGDTLIKVDTAELQNAIKRVSLIARRNTNAITLETKRDRLIITADDQGEQAKEELEIEINGEDKLLKVDAGYIKDLLKCIDDYVLELQLIDKTHPLYVEEGQAKYVIMPIRPGA
ncbi:DNA polymerase III subunit beta [Halocella sp. SP3-1]|uniref:DNA polymerase III subunit beta n=1 Tax=Halocella sp. SP3-1 TaxID=2382161 RepID=UPI000F75903C|nr:DNA polymerase III subunit beta [Halocella sp. SP3-1]AZO96166.1 DNA polymerase III subunit beta [Halocella sp. SP3-1]